MDRNTAIAYLVDHYRNPRCHGRIEDADVRMPGGNPGCGDVVTLHVKADPAADRIAKVSFEGSGCTISQAAASILLERVNRKQLTFANVLELSYDEMVNLLGREVVGSRPRCATLALGTLKAAVRVIEMDRRLRAAGHSDEEIRQLREAVAAKAAGDGLVFGAAAQQVSPAGEGA